MMLRREALILFMFVVQPVAAQKAVTDERREALSRSIDAIYNLEFTAAQRDLQVLKDRDPSDPTAPFFLAMVEWGRILVSFEDESRDEHFYDMLEEVIDLCDERLDKNPNDVLAMFFKGGAIGFRGRLRANRGSWLSAAKDGMGALPLVRQAYALDPKNKDVLLGIGIYNYYAAVVPDRYPLVKPLMVFFPSGDRKKGLEQLREASEQGLYAKVEASYFLLQNYYLFERDFSRSLELAQRLHTRYPRNPVFHRYVGRSLVSLGRSKEAADVFREMIKRVEQKWLGYDGFDAREAHYYCGKYLFFAGDYPKALAEFRKTVEYARSVEKGEPSGFRAMAHLNLAMLLDLAGKREEALQNYRIVLAMKEVERSHQEARIYMKKPYGKQP